MADLEEMTAVTPADLVEWYKMKKQLAALKVAENLLRNRIFKFFFKTPTEGTNSHPLKDGTGAVLKAVHGIARKIDESELEALRDAMATEGSNLPEFGLTKLIKWKPELSISEYRKLSDEDKQIFDRVLIVKPESPQVDIVIPKRGA